MIGLYIALGVIAFFLLATLVIAYITYRITFYSPDKIQNDIHYMPPDEQTDARRDEMLAMIDAFDAIPYEDVTTTSHDGLKLHARYVRVKDGGPVAICCHGYRGTSIRDFCGAGLIPRSLGQNLLLIDERACRDSEGHAITFGIKERLDILTWIEFVRNTFGENTPISLYGASMGAATVLMVSGLPLPENVTHIVADSPYTAPREIIEKVCRVDMHIPPKLAMPFLSLGAKLFAHININDGNVIEAVKKSPVRILLIHGERDSFVPTEMSRRIAKASPETVTLETFPGAGHVLSYITDQPRYETLVIDYLSNDQKIHQ